MKISILELHLGSVYFLYPNEEYDRLGLEKIRQDIVREGQKLTPADTGRSVSYSMGYSVDDDMSLLVDYDYIMDTAEYHERTSHSYYVNEAKQEELLQSLKEAINNTDNMAAAIFSEAYESAECTMVQIRKDTEEENLDIENADVRERVFKAFLKDLQEGKVAVENWDRYSFFEEDGIGIYFQVEISDEKLKEAGVSEDLWWQYLNSDFEMALTEEMENTWKEVQGLKETDLKEMGYRK